MSVGHGVQSDLEEFRDGELKTAYRWQQGFIAGLPVRSDYAQASGLIAFNVDDPDHAMNVAVPDGDHLRKITHEGDDQLQKMALGPVRAVQWKSKEGIALEGIATFPLVTWRGTNIRSWCCHMAGRSRMIVRAGRSRANDRRFRLCRSPTGISGIYRLRRRVPRSDLSTLWGSGISVMWTAPRIMRLNKAGQTLTGWLSSDGAREAS